MKKIFLPLLFCLTALLWAEVGSMDGIGLNLNFSSSIERNTDSDGDSETASEYDFLIQPTFHFRPDKETEFVPYLTYGMNLNRDEDSISSDINEDSYRMYLGGGTSLFWHFLKTWRIDLVSGMEGDLLFGLDEKGDGDDDKDFSAALSFVVPIAMDFIMTRDLTIRLSADLMKLSFTYDKSADDDGKDITMEAASSFPFLNVDDDDMALVSLAAIYWFGNRK
ncbi:MAG: hypothetical protein PQJ59_04495 [Spirochaetales bacterium]|nr:hypothetical protein [Spirochaetales bacterium]